MISINFLESFLKHLNRLEFSHINQVIGNLKDDYHILLRALKTLYFPTLIIDNNLNLIFSNEKANDFFFIDHADKIGNLENIILYPQLMLPMKDFIKNNRDPFLKKEIIIEGFLPKVLDLTICFIEEGKENNPSLFLVTFEDITMKIKEQKENRLRKNILSMDHLAAGLAHEIRNPLASIKLYLDLLKRSSNQLDPDSELYQDISQSMNVIQEEVERLNNITSDFLTTIRPLSLNLGRFQGKDISQYLLDIFKAELTSKKILFTIKEQENLPFLLGDLNYIKIVFFNLMKNAIDSYDDYKKRNTKKITLTIEENAPFIEINLQDNGKGMDPKDIDRVFEPYFTTKKQGSGIGLSMVYKIVSEHQGTIQMKSIKSKGTTFIVLIPIYKGSIRKFLSRKNL